MSISKKKAINLILSAPSMLILLLWVLIMVSNLVLYGIPEFIPQSVSEALKYLFIDFFMGNFVIWALVPWLMLYIGIFMLLYSVAGIFNFVFKVKSASQAQLLEYYSFTFWANISVILLISFTIFWHLVPLYNSNWMVITGIALPFLLSLFSFVNFVARRSKKVMPNLLKLEVTIYPLTLIYAFIIIFLGIVAIYDAMPRIYSDIKFGDKNGKYIVNYDGDYWLTYYIDKNSCYKTPGTVCYPDWVKKGNASIMESPVDLKPFIDQEVAIDASPRAIDYHYRFPDKKPATCIVVNALDKVCTKSAGPGNWEMSPLVINSIKLAK